MASATMVGPELPERDEELPMLVAKKDVQLAEEVEVG